MLVPGVVWFYASSAGPVSGVAGLSALAVLAVMGAVTLATYLRPAGGLVRATLTPCAAAAPLQMVLAAFCLFLGATSRCGGSRRSRWPARPWPSARPERRPARSARGAAPPPESSPKGSALGGLRSGRRFVSYMRTATTRPDAAVRAATTQIADRSPRRRPAGRRAAPRRRSRRPATAGTPRPSAPARRGARRHRWRRAGSGRPSPCPAPSRTAADRPPAEAGGPATSAEGRRLQCHAADDEPLAAPPVRQRSGDELPEAPHGGVEGGQHADAGERAARRRRTAPGTGPRPARR